MTSDLTGNNGEPVDIDTIASPPTPDTEINFSDPLQFTPEQHEEIRAAQEFLSEHGLFDEYGWLFYRDLNIFYQKCEADEFGQVTLEAFGSGKDAKIDKAARPEWHTNIVELAELVEAGQLIPVTGDAVFDPQPLLEEFIRVELINAIPPCDWTDELPDTELSDRLIDVAAALIFGGKSESSDIFCLD